MIEDLRQEYLADLAEEIAELGDRLSADAGDGGSASKSLGALREFAFHLKGQSHNFGLSIIHAVAHRMQDYYTDLPALGERDAENARAFLDALTDLVEGAVPADADPSEIVRSLPARPGIDVADLQALDVEVLLVMPPGTVARLVQRELQECGYRVSTVASAFEALPLVVRTKPNMVIISAVIDELSGTALATALTGMTETRNIPVALITSFEKDHESLRHLPDSVPIIQKGKTFGDDL
ncbi:MAG: Hpt domain-containing protein, partial [Alphaproteobacteria bacterium]